MLKIITKMTPKITISTSNYYISVWYVLLIYVAVIFPRIGNNFILQYFTDFENQISNSEKITRFFKIGTVWLFIHMEDNFDYR
jgi:hypothetical protein